MQSLAVSVLSSVTQEYGLLEETGKKLDCWVEPRIWFVVLASESFPPLPHAFDGPVGIVELTHSHVQSEELEWSLGDRWYSKLGNSSIVP